MKADTVAGVIMLAMLCAFYAADAYIGAGLSGAWRFLFYGVFIVAFVVVFLFGYDDIRRIAMRLGGKP